MPKTIDQEGNETAQKSVLRLCSCTAQVVQLRDNPVFAFVMSKSIENPSSAVPKIELPSLEPETLEELRDLLREHIAPLVPDFAHLSINQQRAWGHKLRQLRESHPAPGFVEWADDVLYELEHFHISRSAEKVALFPTVFSDL